MWEILELDEVSSTQKIAKNLAQKGKIFFVVWAKKQTQGKGKGKRKFFSPEGGLYFSLVLPPKDPLFLMNLGSFCAKKVLKKNFPHLLFFLKFPNDIYLFSKKVGGVLAENVIKGKKVLFSVLGIGINLNTKKLPDEIKEIATSCYFFTKKEVSLKKILKEILEEIDFWLQKKEEFQKIYQKILSKEIIDFPFIKHSRFIRS